MDRGSAGEEGREHLRDGQTTPRPSRWGDRLKSVYPLPGGYDGYLETLDRILHRVDEVRPDRTNLQQWLQETFGASPGSAGFQLSFLERISLLEVDANQVEITQEGRSWLASRDNAFLVGLMHSRIQLIGELLALLDRPRTADELLELANARYGMGWKSKAQIDRRRGWLQSAGVIGVDEENRLQRTELGDDLLGTLEVREPIEESEGKKGGTGRRDGPVVPLPDDGPASDPRLQRARRLHELLNNAAHQSDDPDAFERLVAEAFAFLGFESTWLGGSGKTDVLLVAELGPEDGYRVIVDCKTTRSGGIPDQQIDWVTLGEHLQFHDADLVALVGPSFMGSRVRERAEKHRVTLLDVDVLGGLLRQHARIPLGLDAYHHLFGSSDGNDGSAVIAELAEEEDRLTRLAATIVRLISENEGKEGPLGPRDLYWLLKQSDDDVGEYSQSEIGGMVEALSAPGVGVLRAVGSSYLTLGSRATIAARLHHLAALITEGDAEP